MHPHSRRRTMLALAGATTGLAALLAPSAAYAGPAPERTAPERTAPEPVAPQAGAAEGGGVGAAAAVCQSWTDYVTGPGTPYNVYIPSTTRNGNQPDCILAQGHATDGVYKLQDALIRCYGRNIAKDGIYGAQTTAAVRYVQNFHRINPDGAYGPNTRAAMTWPKYYNGNFHHC